MAQPQAQAQEDGSGYELKLEDVLGVYRSALSTRCLFVSGFIQRVKKFKGPRATAAIAKDGTFYYSPEWFERMVTTPGRLQDVCMHEMMHPLLNDLAREASDMGNIAGDAVINSMLFNLGLSPCELFEAMYDTQGVYECILRPRSSPPAQYVGLYAALYPTLVNNKADSVENPLEVLEALKVLHQGEDTDTQLVGSHGNDDAPKDEEGKEINLDDMTLPGEIQGDLCEHLGEKMENAGIGGGGGGGGFGSVVNTVLMSVIRSKKSLKSEVLKDFAVRDSINKLRQAFKAKTPRRSVIPTQMTRSEAMQVAAGRPPLFYTVRTPKDQAFNKAGIDFYIDVSGSVMDVLPKVVGLFHELRGDIKKIWAFSNVIEEVPIDQFLAGKIPSTLGTDFDCVIEHAVKHRCKKMLILTDGDADANEENIALAKVQIPRIGLVYFGSWVNKNNWIHQHYNIAWDLEDLVS